MSYTCMKMTFEEAREKLKAIDFRPMLTPSKGKLYQCPFCGSGTHANRTGAAKYYQDSNRLFCHACNNANLQGRAADAIDIYQYTTRAAGHAAAVFEMADEYGIEITDRSRPEQARRNAPRNDFKDKSNDLPEQAPKPPQNAPEAAAKVDYTEYYNQCAARLTDPAAIKYLKRRGISLETAKAAHLGFDPDADPACNPGGKGTARHPAPRIIIPTTATHYTARAIDPGAEYPKLNAGSPGIFNAAALYTEEQEVFVAEGAFNALSIIEAGAQAIAINGTSNAEKFVQTMAAHPTRATLIICPDNDPDGAGEKAAQKIREGLQRLNLNYIDADITAQYNDANEYLTANRTAFFAAVKEAQRMAEEHRANRNTAQSFKEAPKNDFKGTPNDLPAETSKTAETAPKLDAADTLTAQAAERQAQIDALLEKASTERFKPIPTGIPALDEKLDGGLISKTLVFLGAKPGAGKTALASQIFEHIARTGRLVVYYNLEMDREVLQARSLARIAYKGGSGQEITANDILRGYKATETTRRAIREAAQDYKENIAPFLEYSAGSSGLTELLDDMNTKAETAEKAGQPAPHICIDYLQLITGDRHEDTQATIKRAVKAFKKYAIEHNAIVFVITAQNRTANKEDKPTMQAGRDSSAIEYSGDLQLQLTGGANGKIKLNITKSRYTQADTEIEFYFKGGQSYFSSATPRKAGRTIGGR